MSSLVRYPRPKPWPARFQGADRDELDALWRAHHSHFPGGDEHTKHKAALARLTAGTPAHAAEIRRFKAAETATWQAWSDKRGPILKEDLERSE